MSLLFSPQCKWTLTQSLCFYLCVCVCVCVCVWIESVALDWKGNTWPFSNRNTSEMTVILRWLLIFTSMKQVRVRKVAPSFTSLPSSTRWLQKHYAHKHTDKTVRQTQTYTYSVVSEWEIKVKTEGRRNLTWAEQRRIRVRRGLFCAV